jgi:hypothetical protein
LPEDYSATAASHLYGGRARSLADCACANEKPIYTSDELIVCKHTIKIPSINQSESCSKRRAVCVPPRPVTRSFSGVQSHEQQPDGTHTYVYTHTFINMLLILNLWAALRRADHIWSHTTFRFWPLALFLHRHQSRNKYSSDYY